VTPLWAGIYMIPLTIGFLVSAPLSGLLSDKFGARAFTVGGALLTAASFLCLFFVPVDFRYPVFAAVLAVNGFGSGLFASPNRAEIMNSVPPNQRGAAGGMIATFQNAAFVLSIGIFFTLIVTGLAGSLPSVMFGGLTAQGVPAAAAHQISHLPPIALLFSAFLGYNPMKQILGSKVLSHLPPGHAATLTSHSFFPHLISTPFHDGLSVAFIFAIAANVVAALASVLTRSRRLRGAAAVAGARVAPAGGPVLSGAAAVSNGSRPAEAPAPGGAPAPGDAPAAGDVTVAGDAIPAGDTTVTGDVTVAGDAIVAGGPPVPERTPAAGDVSGSAITGPAAAGSAVTDPAGAACTVRGVVRDRRGNPVPGAVLTVLRGDGWQAGRTVADAAGGYELTDVASRAFTLIAQARGYAPEAAAVTADGGVVSRDVALAGAGGLAGAVRSAADAPLPGATVVISDASGAVLAQEVTGRDGKFLLPGLTEGSYTVSATAAGHRPASTQVEVNGATRTTSLALMPEAEVHGVVKDRSDTPVPGVTVSLANTEGEVVASVVTGADGGYRLTGLDGGEHTLVAGGYQPVSTVVRIEDGQTSSVTVRLGAGPDPGPA
jgi:hypothetical protein